MTNKNIHTVKRPDGTWANMRENSERASGIHKTQQAAITQAKQLAQKDQVEHLIHGVDNKIRERNSYGNDQFPPKG